MTDLNDDKTSTHTILTEGMMVSHYRIDKKIGAGGMGEVYLADDTRLDRKVALKFLPIQLATDSDMRARFTREAQATARLDHPNIVTIHEVSEHIGRPFFAMQYVTGKSLDKFRDEQTLSIARAVQLVAQVAEGLGKAHAVGITHRDIKSANIMIDADSIPRILDFGLATVQGTDGLTKTGSTLGTVAYMSPEQAQGGEVDHRSDLFSLGVVLYELIAGKGPFKRTNDASTLRAIVSEAPEPLARYKNDVPDDLERIVSKALAKNRAERYQSAADFAADLRTVGRMIDAKESGVSGAFAANYPSVAVLPFANMSADPDNEFFSDGLTEELLNVLAKNPGLKVTGRTSSFAFKGKQEDLRAIGHKLGVETLLEGSVRKAGNRARITAQLVKVSDGFHIWSETYDRVLDDIFAVQDDIAQSVSEALHVKLVGPKHEKPKPKFNAKVYELIVRGHQLFQNRSGESLAAAVELFERAIAIEPNNARAWSELAHAIGHQIAYGHALHADLYPKAKQAAVKALELDEMLPEAHQAMAFICIGLEMEYNEGIRYEKRAYELAPSNSSIVSHYSRTMAIFGKVDEAQRLARQAVELDPLNPMAHAIYAHTLEYVGKTDEALKTFDRAMEISPYMTALRANYALLLTKLKRFDEAVAMASKEKLVGYRAWALAVVYQAMGEHEKSNEQLEELLAAGDEWAVQIGQVYSCQGKADEAFKWLDRAWEIKDSGIPIIKLNEWYSNIYSDPRWPAFLEKVGLADHQLNAPE